VLSKNIPGYSIGLFYSDSVFVYNYGGNDLDENNTLKESTTFELGGLSKVFTATLIEILVSEGTIFYTKPLNEYLENSYKNEHLADLTIEDLITHRSRLPKLPYEFGVKEKEINNPYAHYTKKDLLAFYKDFKADPESQKEYFYSNVNFALLEIAIENATGKPYHQVLREKLFDPLQMKNSFVHIDPSKGKLPCPGYSISGKQVKPLKFQSFAASEGIKSSMQDLVAFVNTNIGKNTSELSALFYKTQEPMDETNLNKDAKVAKGWHVLKNRKYYNAILHSGSTNGHRAYIGFVKETQTAVIVLSNSEHAMDGLGFLILRMLNHNWKKKRK